MQACAQELRSLDADNPCAFYMSSTYEQTLPLAQTLLNANSINFLNTARIERPAALDTTIDAFKAFLDEHKINPEHVCLIGDSAAVIRGERDACQKLVVIYHDADQRADIMKHADFVNDCNIAFKNDRIAHDEIIFNPCNHFYYRGIKCALKK
jgi:hypothetical protein